MKKFSAIFVVLVVCVCMPATGCALLRAVKGPVVKPPEECFYYGYIANDCGHNVYVHLQKFYERSGKWFTLYEGVVAPNDRIKIGLDPGKFRACMFDLESGSTDYLEIELTQEQLTAAKNADLVPFWTIKQKKSFIPIQGKSVHI